MIVLKAKVVDSAHLELSSPLVARRGLCVVVSVAESAEADTDRQKWAATSALSLQGAYGDSEPNYTDSMVKESNPDYDT